MDGEAEIIEVDYPEYGGPFAGVTVRLRFEVFDSLMDDGFIDEVVTLKIDGKWWIAELPT